MRFCRKTALHLLPIWNVLLFSHANGYTVSSVLEAAASILSRGSVLRLKFKCGLYLRAASNTTLLKLHEIRTKICTFSSKIDVFSSKTAKNRVGAASI